jgi:very-short-patch-repair endonuclease
MGGEIDKRSSAAVHELVKQQHGVVARTQLLALGFTQKAIEHRLASGRLLPIRRGVYAVGRPEVTQRGRWMAAVLACGPKAALSHSSAASLWEISVSSGRPIEVTVPNGVRCRQRGIAVHTAGLDPTEITRRHGIPVTSPASTLVDLATSFTRGQLEAAVNQADRLDLIALGDLREALAQMARRPGLGVLKRTLDQRTFRLTDSELERRFLALVAAAGLPRPETGRYLSGFKVDFYWPELGLVVETDGLRYHRTPAQQARDRLRDQAHTAAGLTPLRFTHGQVRYEPEEVRMTLETVIRRQRAQRPG